VNKRTGLTALFLAPCGMLTNNIYKKKLYGLFWVKPGTKVVPMFEPFNKQIDQRSRSIYDLYRDQPPSLPRDQP